jgi:hypothetical protein
LSSRSTRLQSRAPQKRKLHRAAQGGNIHEKAGSRMRGDREKWRQLVKAAGIKMEE